MEAVIFQITENKTKEVVYEGIVRDVYDSIFPGQHIFTEDGKSIDGMPHECELRKFDRYEVASNYTLDSCEIDITWNEALKYKIG
jgi:hypothetical protein